MMQHQPNLFSAEPPPPELPSRARGEAAPVQPQRQTASSPWLRQLEVWVRIIVQLYLGALIVALPWLHFWSDNSLFSYSPAAASVASSGFVRGLVSGLGLLNLYLAVSEALRSRKF